MFRQNKMAIALLGAFIWLFSLKTAAALSFSAMADAEMPIRAAGEFVGFPFSVVPDRSFLRSSSVLPAAAPPPSVSDMDFSAVRTDGFDMPNEIVFFKNPPGKPLMSGVMGAEAGRACANPTAGSGTRNPATFTWMAVGFAGMIGGRFRMGRL